MVVASRKRAASSPGEGASVSMESGKRKPNTNQQTKKKVDSKIKHADNGDKNGSLKPFKGDEPIGTEVKLVVSPSIDDKIDVAKELPQVVHKQAKPTVLIPLFREIEPVKYCDVKEIHKFVRRSERLLDKEETTGAGSSLTALLSGSRASAGKRVRDTPPRQAAKLSEHKRRQAQRLLSDHGDQTSKSSIETITSSDESVLEPSSSRRRLFSDDDDDDDDDGDEEHDEDGEEVVLVTRKSIGRARKPTSAPPSTLKATRASAKRRLLGKGKSRSRVAQRLVSEDEEEEKGESSEDEEEKGDGSSGEEEEEDDSSEDEEEEEDESLESEEEEEDESSEEGETEEPKRRRKQSSAPKRSQATAATKSRSARHRPSESFESKNRKPQQQLSSSSSSSSSAAAAAANSTSPRRQKRSPTRRAPPKLLLSSFDNDRRLRLETIASSLGMQVSEDVADETCTHVIVPQPKRHVKCRRTMKVLVALARGIPIVSDSWITECERKGRICSSGPYELNDIFPGIQLRASTNRDLLDGFTVHVMDKTIPEPEHIALLISMSGGQLASSLRSCDICIGPEQSFRSVRKRGVRFLADSSFLDALQIGQLPPADSLEL